MALELRHRPGAGRTGREASPWKSHARGGRVMVMPMLMSSAGRYPAAGSGIPSIAVVHLALNICVSPDPSGRVWRDRRWCWLHASLFSDYLMAPSHLTLEKHVAFADGVGAGDETGFLQLP